MSSIRERIQERLDEIERSMNANEREGIEDKIQSVSKFWSALSEEERDFINAVRFAVEDNLEWK